MTTDPIPKGERAMIYEEAEKLALRAIHDSDGRGMIGRGQIHLHQRVARAILAAAALPTGELLSALKGLDAVLGDTPMPDCAAMNRLIAASSRARAAVAEAEAALLHQQGQEP